MLSIGAMRPGVPKYAKMEAAKRVRVLSVVSGNLVDYNGDKGQGIRGTDVCTCTCMRMCMLCICYSIRLQVITHHSSSNMMCDALLR